MRSPGIAPTQDFGRDLVDALWSGVEDRQLSQLGKPI
jgi:hypothetical protein